MQVLLIVAVLLHAKGTSLEYKLQRAGSESLLALSKRNHDLSIIDPSSLRIVAKVPVGNDPHEVIASADGTRAYVSNYGFGAFNTLAVIDLVKNRALPSIDLGALRGPHGLTFVGGEVWFTAEAAKALGRFDPASHKVDLILGTGQNRTHMIYVSKDGKQIVATNVNSGTVSIIDQTSGRGPGGPPPGGFGRRGGPGGPPPDGPPPGGPGGPPPGGPPPDDRPGGPGGPGGPRRGGPGGPGGPRRPDWNETVIRVGNDSEGFDVSPDHREVWVANSEDGTLSVVNLAAKVVTQTLNVNVRGANRLKFTVDGKRVLVSNLGGSDVVVLDAKTRREIKRIPVGHGSAGILMEPSGARAFVACSPDDYIAVIDLRSLKVTGQIHAGGEPDGLAWSTRK